MSFRSAIPERDAPVGLEDLSARIRALRIQGAYTVAFLVENGISCPGEIFGVSRAGNNGGPALVARIGSADVNVQDERGGGRIDALRVASANAQGVVSTPDEGARLRLTGSVDAPDTFELFIELDGLWVDCEVVWRSNAEIGVAFTSPKTQATPRRKQVLHQTDTVTAKPSLRRKPIRK